MSIYRLPRNLEAFAIPSRPETIGVDMECARNLAAAARACITLSTGDTEPFLASLPKAAPDYHSYDDLTEVIWRNWLSDPNIKPYAKEKPNIARGKSIAIWDSLIKYGSPELHKELAISCFEHVDIVKSVKSTKRRTVISDPTIYSFYEKTQNGHAAVWMGKTTLTAIQMLLAGTHPDLIEADWPEEVLEFMGGDYQGL